MIEIRTEATLRKQDCSALFTELYLLYDLLSLLQTEGVDILLLLLTAVSQPMHLN